jgi:hypothetical protein
MSKLKLNVLIILTLLIFYYLQGVLYSSIQIISQIILSIYLLLNFYFFFRTLSIQKNNLSIKVLALFIFLVLIHLLIEVLVYGSSLESIIKYLKPLLISLLPFFTFYYAGIKSLNINKILVIYFIVFFGISIVSFFQFEQKFQLLDDVDNVVNNVSYRFVLMIPYLFFLKNKTFKLIIIVLIITFVILSSKRGALLSLLLGLTFYFKFYLKKISKFNSRFIFIILILATSIFINYIINSNLYIATRLNTSIDSSTGRIEIFANLLEYYNNISAYLMLFGSGILGTFKNLGNYAHNDFIEVWVNFGLVGLFLYSIFVASIVKLIKNIKFERKSRYILLVCILIWVSKTLSTGVFTAISSSLLTIIMGYTIGYENRKSKYEIYQ